MTYFDIIEEDYYQNYEGRAYSCERVRRTMMTEQDARAQAQEWNLTRVGSTYYSIRPTKTVDESAQNLYN